MASELNTIYIHNIKNCVRYVKQYEENIQYYTNIRHKQQCN